MYYHNGRITIDLDQILHHNIVFSPIIHLLSCLIYHAYSPSIHISLSMRLITYLYIKLFPENEELNPQLVIYNSWNMATLELATTPNLENTLSKNYLHIANRSFVWRFPRESGKWGCYAQNPCLGFLRFVSICPQIKTRIKVFLCGMRFWLRL